MIEKVTLRYFKRFEEETFELTDHVILAGPNNCGKSTLLQAIVAWNLALQRWMEKRGPQSGSKAKQRTGVALTRKDFTALPLREMDLLWTNAQTGLRQQDIQDDNTQKLGQHRVLTITLTGQHRNGDGEWTLGFEFRRQSTELVYIRPLAEHFDELEGQAPDIGIVHVPPFSGIGSEETRYDHPYQDLLIGQGKAGDILRNLLLEVYNRNDKSHWESLRQCVEDIFGYRLLPPEYEGLPYILCEYLAGIPQGRGKNGLAQLDVASAGSGFHQVLLLLGFFYARPATVLLLDEPDAHLHIILQKQIYDLLRRIAAERRCQLVIATHAEVLIDNTSPNQILSFYDHPHILEKDTERDQVREALKCLTATDLLMADRSPGVLYLEGQKDFDLLAAWARVLDHPLTKWLKDHPFWHDNKGRHPREAKNHFFALRAIKTDIRGLLLLDGDNRDVPDREVVAEELALERWTRYEAESYLIQPAALLRFIESQVGGSLLLAPAQEYLRNELPPAVYEHPLREHEYLQEIPARKTLLPGLFRTMHLRVNTNEYYRIAEQMQPGEVPQEVSTKLDAIWRAVAVEPA